MSERERCVGAWEGEEGKVGDVAAAAAAAARGLGVEGAKLSGFVGETTSPGLGGLAISWLDVLGFEKVARLQRWCERGKRFMRSETKLAAKEKRQQQFHPLISSAPRQQSWQFIVPQ